MSTTTRSDETPSTTPRTASPLAPTSGARVAQRPLGPDCARVTGGFWGTRLERNGRAAIRSGYDRLEDAGNLENLRIAAGTATGDARGPIFMDSDVYKWLEALAWEYGREPADDLLRLQREVTALVASAQEDDGYLDSVHSIRFGREGRYHDLPWSHELYCAGHLFQAAVAQSRATGDTALLEVAVRLADHLVATFGDGAEHVREVDGHPVVEMGLVELYRQTGTRSYLDLASWFVEARGHGIIAAHGKEPTYFSDRIPVREAETVEGHAVRAVYLGAGATDVAIETGDEQLLAALERQFAAMLATKTYITGGLGARWEGEAFGDPYELPSDRGYAETCAAIGGIQWAERLLIATGRPEYAAAIERMLYNAFLPGVSLAGTEYFYVNALQVRGGAEADDSRAPVGGRQGWYQTACCPPNIMRTFADLGAYVATESDGALHLHQYVTGDYAGGGGAVHVESDLPHRGTVRVEITESPGEDWTIELRMPVWSDASTVSVGGEVVEEAVRPGSVVELRRRFQPGETIELRFDMSVHRYAPDARIDAARSSVALERGPLVYAVEAVDQNGASVDEVRVAADAEIREHDRPDLLDGVVALELAGTSAPDPDAPWPYARVGDAAERVATEATVTAIPYYAWANRRVGPMRVWLPTA